MSVVRRKANGERFNLRSKNPGRATFRRPGLDIRSHQNRCYRDYFFLRRLRRSRRFFEPIFLRRLGLPTEYL